MINKYKSESDKWKHWVSVVDDKRCLPCEKMHGKIYGIYEIVWDLLKRHSFCTGTDIYPHNPDEYGARRILTMKTEEEILNG